MPFSTFTSYNYLLDEEDKKKKPSQIAAKEQKFKTFSRLGEQALSFVEEKKPVATQERTPSVWETAKKKAGEITKNIIGQVGKIIPKTKEEAQTLEEKIPGRAMFAPKAEELLPVASKYATDTLSMAVNAIEGVGKLTPIYQTYRAILGNPVTPKEHAETLLGTGLDVWGLSWRTTPIAPFAGATFNTWKGVRQYFQGKIDAGELQKMPIKGIAEQPGLGEAITDNIELAEKINTVFLGVMFVAPFAKKSLDKMNLKAQEINKLSEVLDIKPTATSKEVSEAIRNKVKQNPDSFSPNPTGKALTVRKQIDDAITTLKNANVLDKNYAEAYSFIQKKFGKMADAIKPTEIVSEPKQLPTGEKPPTVQQKFEKAIQTYVSDEGVYKKPTGEITITPSLKELTDISQTPEAQAITKAKVKQAITTGEIKPNEKGEITVYRVGSMPKEERLVSVSFDKTAAEQFAEQASVVGKARPVTELTIKQDDIKVFIGGTEKEVLIQPMKEEKPSAVITEAKKIIPEPSPIEKTEGKEEIKPVVETISKEEKPIKPTSAETAKMITKEVPREQLPVGGGKEKVSRLEARVKDVLTKVPQEKIDELGLSTYQQMNKKENIKSASEYVVNNPDEALQVLSGEKEAPKGILRNSIYVAMENQAKGDVELARKLASLQSTRIGQELSILTELDPDSPVKAMSDIVKVRIKEFDKRYKGKTATEMKKNVVKIIKSKVKAPSKDDWSAFISSIQC